MKKTLMMALLGTAVLTGQAQADMFEDVEATEHRVSFASPADYFEFTFTGFKVPSGDILLAVQKPVAHYEVKTKVPRQIAIGWGNNYTGQLNDMEATVPVMPGTSLDDSLSAVFGFDNVIGDINPEEGTVLVDVDGKAYFVTPHQVTRQAGNIWFHAPLTNSGSFAPTITTGKYRLNMTAAVYNP